MDICGYSAIYDINSHLANKSGIVYEHRVIAEQLLGRALIAGECVHHIDENRSNNVDNIIVFSTKADHARFHKLMAFMDTAMFDIIVKQDNGSYRCKCKKEIPGNEWMPCPVCNTLCVGKYCSVKCVSVSQRRVIRPTKSELTLLVEHNTIVSIGKMFGVSDNAVRKWVKSYNLAS